MKSVLASFKPQYCELIASGKKTIELRKTRPKLDVPFKCYVYCTLANSAKKPNNNLWLTDKTGFNCFGNGKVIGEFVCDEINFALLYVGKYPILCEDVLNKSCLSMNEIEEYSSGKDCYAWHISDLVIYDKPKELGEFYHICPHKKHCVDCIYSINEERAFYDESIGCDRQLSRAPQSWCYVEEEQK